MKIQILTIGDEILIGQIVDTNSAWMGQQLNANGGQIIEISSLSDTHTSIVNGLDNALQQADVVLMTGGLGPTKDDITKKAIADYFGVDMVFHQGTYDRIKRFFDKWGRSMTQAHHDQCYMPANALLLKNKMGTAPGMWFEKEGKVIISMPGVPYEMKYLMEHEVIPRLKERFIALPIAHRTILTIGEGESRIAKKINSVAEELPDFIKLAFLPNLGRVRLRLTGMHEDETYLNEQLNAYQEKMVSIIPDLVFGYGTETIESVIGRMLQEKGLMLGLAESCTGGYLAHLITSISGSSRYFQGGVVAYSNAIKEKQLNVPKEILEEHGAVSEQTVRAMVSGANQLLQTDVSISISGIAGPTGGTEEKPVGTIWMAVGNDQHIETRLLSLGKDRLRNIQFTSVQALNFLRQFLNKYYS